MTKTCPHIDFTSDDMRDHLYERVADLRSERPVARTEAHGGYWVLTRYEDILSVLQDPETFTSTQGVTVPFVESPLRTVPFEADPPEHRDFRRAMNGFLTPEAARGMEDDVRRIADSYIDSFIDDGRCDLPTAFSEHISSTILFRNLLGADEQEMARCHEAVMKFAYEPTSDAAVEGALHLMQFCYGLVEARRAEPDDGLVTSIATSTIVGRPVEDLEAIGMLAILIFGGVETTANATTSAIIRLAEQPDLQRAMREDPSLIGLALDELLRLDPPLIGLARRATRDVEIGGMQIKQGEAVYYSIAAANRDPDEFPHPDELRLDRERNRHLTFSGGIHRCAGSNLAKVMLRVSLEQLLARLDDIELDGPVEYIQSAARGIVHCPIRFNARAVDATSG